MHRSVKMLVRLGLPVVALMLAGPKFARAACVDGDVCAGYDLFQTATGTTFAGIEFQGVPLGNFDFGGSIGVQNTGLTDTIVQRMDDVTPPSGSTPIEIKALQLESSTPVPVQGGSHFLFASLTGTPSPGMMTIDITTPATPTTPGSGTLTSTMPVSFKITLDSYSGPDAGLCPTTVCTGTLSSTGAPWTSEAPACAVLIDGVDHMLDGTDSSADFFPDLNEVASFNFVSNWAHNVEPALQAVPEPATPVLLGSALLALGVLLRRSAQPAAAS